MESLRQQVNPEILSHSYFILRELHLLPFYLFFSFSSTKFFELCTSLFGFHYNTGLPAWRRRATVRVETERLEIFLHCNSRCGGQLPGGSSISVHNANKCPTSGLFHNSRCPSTELGRTES